MITLKKYKYKHYYVYGIIQDDDLQADEFIISSENVRWYTFECNRKYISKEVENQIRDEIAKELNLKENKILILTKYSPSRKDRV